MTGDDDKQELGNSEGLKRAKSATDQTPGPGPTPADEASAEDSAEDSNEADDQEKEQTRHESRRSARSRYAGVVNLGFESIAESVLPGSMRRTLQFSRAGTSAADLSGLSGSVRSAIQMAQMNTTMTDLALPKSVLAAVRSAEASNASVADLVLPRSMRETMQFCMADSALPRSMRLAMQTAESINFPAADLVLPRSHSMLAQMNASLSEGSIPSHFRLFRTATLPLHDTQTMWLSHMVLASMKTWMESYSGNGNFPGLDRLNVRLGLASLDQAASGAFGELVGSLVEDLKGENFFDLIKLADELDSDNVAEIEEALSASNSVSEMRAELSAVEVPSDLILVTEDAAELIRKGSLKPGILKEKIAGLFGEILREKGPVAHPLIWLLVTAATKLPALPFAVAVLVALSLVIYNESISDKDDAKGEGN